MSEEVKEILLMVTGGIFVGVLLFSSFHSGEAKCQKKYDFYDCMAIFIPVGVYEKRDELEEFIRNN